MNDVVLAAIKKHGMIAAGDSVVVCVSGGADSMALLHILLGLKDDLGIGDIIACHYNHGLRGAESDADENFVKEYCTQKKIPLVCGRGNLAKSERPKGESIEMFARKSRYAFFCETAKQYNCDRVAVAHNKNDSTETVIFNLARGTGIKGTAGIPPVRDKLIRPLIEVDRAGIERYCEEHGIPFVTDSTNQSVDFSRNRIRHNVIPELEKINSAAVDNIMKLGSAQSELYAFIDQLVAKTLTGAKSGDEYDIKCMLNDGDVVAKYCVKHLVEACGISPSEKMLELSLEVLHGKLNELQLDDKRFLTARGGFVTIGTKQTAKTQAVFEQKIKEGYNEFLSEFVVCVTTVDTAKIDDLKKKSELSLNNIVDCDKIRGNVVLRNRRDGDTFTSAKRNNTKTLKKLLNEKKVPPGHRDAIPMLCDECGIIWMMGEGAAKRTAVDDKTTSAMLIEIRKITGVGDDA